MPGIGRQPFKANINTFAFEWCCYTNSLLYLPIFPLIFMTSHNCPAPRRRNAYDGEMEYWVVVKETGKRTEESSYEEEHRKRQKVLQLEPPVSPRLVGVV